MSDREQLAAQIRRLAGKHNHPEMAVSSVILGMVGRIAELEQSAMPAFAVTVIKKLRRVDECSSDGQGTDIGGDWLDLLTRLGLLNRTQRSPALWEITQQGEDALAQQGKGGVE